MVWAREAGQGLVARGETRHGAQAGSGQDGEERTGAQASRGKVGGPGTPRSGRTGNARRGKARSREWHGQARH